MSREISPIGKNIKKLRKQKGLSQDRLSKLADISYNTVIKLESGGITNPSINTLQKLAKALDVSVDNLLKWLKTMTKEQKFYKALQDVFIGARIEGEGGFVNLMKIKSNYYRKIEDILKKTLKRRWKATLNLETSFLTSSIHFSAATLRKAAQSISIQRRFTTISTKKFIPMKKMSFSFGKRRCSTMSKPTEFSEVCRLSLTVSNFILTLQK